MPCGSGFVPRQLTAVGPHQSASGAAPADRLQHCVRAAVPDVGAVLIVGKQIRPFTSRIVGVGKRGIGRFYLKHA
jgi:hypothetical protein